MDILDRINALMQGKEQQELTSYLKLNKTAYTDWRSGKSKSYQKYLVEIAKFFNVSIDYLVYGKENTSINLSADEKELLVYFNKLSEKEKIKLIGRAELLAEQAETTEIMVDIPTIKRKHSYYKVSAGTGYGLDEGDAWQDEIEIPDTPANRKADFCITITGNSMEPVYKDGDIVLVKSQKSIDLGQIGIFNVGGKGYIKKYGRDRLISLNEDCDDVMFSDHEYDNIECVGIVLGRI